MSSLPVCNKLSVVHTLVNIARFETCIVLSALLSQEISKSENVGKNKSAEFVLSRVLDASLALVCPTIFLLKITLCYI